MKQIKNIFALLVVALVGLSLTGCTKDDNLNTNQYQGDVALNVYGPSPVMRGGTLRFLGSNLDQVSQVVIPGVDPITNIQVVTAGVPSEIRVIVPHDGPLEGFVTLVTKTGKEITTKTELRYTEGLDPANISMPLAAMPGETIRISVPENGDDYLDLIHMVEFADGVQVGEASFTAHTRYVIELVVPEEAKTGKLNLYTADLTVAEVAESNVDYQIITTVNALEVGTPTVSKLKGRSEVDAQNEITAKAGETISITGTYFNVVADVTIGGVSAEELTVTEDGTGITFTLPAAAPDGEILLVCKSGVEVPVGTIVTVKPSNAVAAPNPVKAGQALTITGQDMDVVTSVTFPNVADAVTEVEVAADKVVVTVPAAATEGELSLNMANGLSVAVPFTLVKPTVTGYDNSSVSAGGALTIQGTDLDLVKTVQFGESDVVNVEGSANAITLSVPMNAQTGSPVLTLANGTTVENVPAINIEEAVFCYFTELPAADAELKAGDAFKLPVANGDKLTGVQINGTNCQYVLANGQLIIGIPTTAKKGSKVRLISSNGEITYTIDFIPNTEVTTVLWKGAVDLASWGFNWEIGKGTNGDNNPNMFKDMELQEGDVIRVYLTTYADWWDVKIYDGHWAEHTEAAAAAGVSSGCEINAGNYNLEEHGGCIEFTATAALVQQLTTLTDWGMCWIMMGEGAVITKIAVTHYNSLETTVWEGQAVADDWGNQPYILSDGGTELLAAGLKVGSVIRCYLTATDATWNCQILDGHWSPNTAFDGCDFSSGNWNLEEHNGAIEFTVTDFIYEHITSAGGWGGSFLLNGDNVICTKVTIE